MINSRVILAFAMSLVVALIVSFFVYRKLISATDTAGASSYPVVVAAKNLALGSRLTETDLRLSSWAGEPPAGTFSDASEVVGRAILYPVFQEELIITEKLAPEGSGAGLQALIPEGMRAVSIRVNDVVAVAGFVGPGAHVDLLLTGNSGDGRDQGEVITKTILEDVQVLTAGQEIQPDAQGKPQTVNVVTLLATPEAAAKIILAASEGRIQLVLRNPTDQKATRVEAMVRRRELYGNVAPQSKPVRRRPPPAPKTVVVVREPAPLPLVGSIQMIRGAQTSTNEVPLGNPSSGSTSGAP